MCNELARALITATRCAYSVPQNSAYTVVHLSACRAFSCVHVLMNLGCRCQQQRIGIYRKLLLSLLSSIFFHYYLVFSHSMAIQLTSLSSLPADVLEHHIFQLLPPSSAVVFSLTCRTARKIFVRARFSYKKHEIIMDISKFDCINYLIWFQEALKYPSILASGSSATLISKFLEAAASGILLTTYL